LPRSYREHSRRGAGFGLPILQRGTGVSPVLAAQQTVGQASRLSWPGSGQPRAVLPDVLFSHPGNPVRHGMCASTRWVL